MRRSWVILGFVIGLCCRPGSILWTGIFRRVRSEVSLGVIDGGFCENEEIRFRFVFSVLRDRVRRGPCCPRDGFVLVKAADLVVDVCSNYAKTMLSRKVLLFLQCSGWSLGDYLTNCELS